MASGATTPGLKVALTSEGSNHVLRTEIPILEKRLSMMHLPGVAGAFYVPLVGKMQYTLHNTVLRKVKILQPSVLFERRAASVLLYNSSCEISAEWSYRRRSFLSDTHLFPPIARHVIPLFDRGSCNATAANASLGLSVLVKVDSGGHPAMYASGCRCDVGELNLSFHSYAHEKERVLYELLLTVMRNHLGKIVCRQLCETAQTSVNEIGVTFLGSIPSVATLDNVSEINYAILKAPSFRPTYVESFHKGEILSIKTPVEAPITPPPTPALFNASRMLYIWLTDYIFNSGGFVYHTSGVLQYTITPDMIPPGFPIKLNTLYFRHLFPQFYNKYPEMGIVLELNTTKPPLVCIIPTSANITIYSAVNVNAIGYNGSRVLAFVLGMKTMVDLKPALRSQGSRHFIYADLENFETQLSLLYNTIGEFNMKAVQQFINFAIDTTIFPEASSYFNRGIPLPVPSAMMFIGPQMTLGEGYFVIATDFKYKPTTTRRRHKSGIDAKLELFPSLLTHL
eukprot:Em0016g880a